MDCPDHSQAGTWIDINLIPELDDPSLNPPYESKDQKKRANRVRKALKDLGGCWCYICYRDLELSKITLDHVIPFSKGGRNKDNLMICCRRCNAYRSVMPLKYFRMLRGFVMLSGRKLELKQYVPKRRGKGKRLTKVIGDARSKV